MADTKISALTADASPSMDDLVVIVDDPGGSPNNKKVTIANLLKALGTPTSGTLSSAILGSVAAYLNYQDQETQNTAGGTFTSGAWRTRVLNTEVSDVGGYGSLASNQITLAAGTYIVSAMAQARLVDRHQLRFQNVTAGTTLAVGQSMFESTGLGSMTVAHLRGVFTVAASQALELQHQAQTTRATDGFGVAGNFTTEVYAIVELWKIG